ncbi:hypothetical protein [Ruminococcus flavefaciens]|uniref:hypothetical protein n=1 Tax=Ruminococcus flavefaciens TaxID=1265 RepID=UPI0026ECC483|nr:hypothetical protein [Ruminococcus flavefaciens]
MKNDDQMYQSVLSRYAEYKEAKKKKRIQTIRRTVPVFACFCLTIALGVGYWDHFRNLPHIPVQPNIIEEPTVEIPETTTTASTDANTTVSSMIPSEPASTTAPTSNSETVRMTTATGIQTQSVTTVVTNATETPTTEQFVKQTETQAPATAPPVTYTQPITDPPVITTVETQAPIVTEPITTTEWIRPIAPPAQPIQFSDISSAIDAINTSDVSSYSEQEQEVYRNMFDRIKSDGFLYHVNNTDTVSLIEDRGITLLPYASYEDVGIGCYVTFNEKNYHITFYYADRDLIAQTNSIVEYLQNRMGRRSDKEINVSNTSVSLFFADNGQTYAGAFIDSDHYFTINSVVSEVEMIELIEALSFEILSLS